VNWSWWLRYSDLSFKLG